MYSIHNRPLEVVLRSQLNKKHHCEKLSLSFPISKELAPEDASIARCGDLDSDHFVVRRLRRHAFSDNSTKTLKVMTFKEASPSASRIRVEFNCALSRIHPNSIRLLYCIVGHKLQLQRKTYGV